MTFTFKCAVVALVVLASSCSPQAGDSQSAAVALARPEDRIVAIETSGCGHASGRTGSGAAVGGGLVVTVAHLVIRSREVSVTVGGRPSAPASVIAVDLDRDLALLSVPGLDVPAVEYAQVSTGATGSVVGGQATGTTPFEVTQVADISIEEVLGTDRHVRRGYAVDAATEAGDSGAGAYDDAGRLIGIVFAFSESPLVTWLTAGREIRTLVDGIDPGTPGLVCDPSLSRLALPTEPRP